jgi:hypothetical protein
MAKAIYAALTPRSLQWKVITQQVIQSLLASEDPDNRWSDRSLVRALGRRGLLGVTLHHVQTLRRDLGYQTIYGRGTNE